MADIACVTIPFLLDKLVTCKNGVFTIDNNSNFSYSIPFESFNYHYIDIFDNSCLNTQYNGEISLLEASKGLVSTINNDNVKIYGNKGYVVIKEEIK